MYEAFCRMPLTLIKPAEAHRYLGRRLERLGIRFYMKPAMLSAAELRALTQHPGASRRPRPSQART